MKSKRFFTFITGFSLLISFIGFFMIVLMGYDRPEASEGIGPRGGHWHITSGGHKSYYQPKTSNWGKKEINNIGIIGWTLMVVFIIIALVSHCIRFKFKNIQTKNNKPLKENMTEKVYKDSFMQKKEIFFNDQSTKLPKEKTQNIEKEEYEKPTEKQKVFMNNHSIKFDIKTTKQQAFKLIGDWIKNKNQIK